MLLDILKTLTVALAVGALCGFTRLPVPAPTVAAGVVGVVGLYLGWLIARTIFPPAS